MTPAYDILPLVELDPDHPGFRDPAYRRRRNEIAQIAQAHQSGDPVPDAPYTDEEHAVWREIRALLAPLHEVHVCASLRTLMRDLPMGTERIPQLRALNPMLWERSGFQMEPVMGLVSGRTFLTWLGKDVFLSTQYIRHWSRPLYTPEPDVVHELIGHAATLCHPLVARVNRVIGRAARAASPTEMVRIERVYWYVMEFGVVQEDGQVRAFGAGLLSSAGEIAQIETGPRLLPWDLDAIAQTPYDPTTMQPHLFVAPSFDRLLGDVVSWIERGDWRDGRLDA